MRSVLGDNKALESLAETIIKEQVVIPGHEIWQRCGEGNVQKVMSILEYKFDQILEELEET